MSKVAYLCVRILQLKFSVVQRTGMKNEALPTPHRWNKTGTENKPFENEINQLVVTTRKGKWPWQHNEITHHHPTDRNGLYCMGENCNSQSTIRQKPLSKVGVSIDRALWKLGHVSLRLRVLFLPQYAALAENLQGRHMYDSSGMHFY